MTVVYYIQPAKKEKRMGKSLLAIGGFMAFISITTGTGHAEKWVKNRVTSSTIKIVTASYHDADSVKVKDKTLSWTEKTELNDEGARIYSEDLRKHAGCKTNMETMGNVTQHQIDYQINDGKFRRIAKRNYNKKNELVCTDKEMGSDFVTGWLPVERPSAIEQTYYDLYVRYNLGHQGM